MRMRKGQIAVWPKNLYEAVYTLYDSDLSNGAKLDSGLRIPADYGEFYGSVEYVIGAALTEREIDVIHLRYREGLSLVEAGENMGVTRERVRQVESKALRKLRDKKWRRIMEVGVTQYIKEQVEGLTQAYCNDKLQFEVSEKVAEIRNEISASEDAKEVLERESPYYSMPIKELGLSVRAYRCLMRSGKETVGDVLAIKNREELISIRNLGKKSANEIAAKLNESGYPCKHLME